MGFLKSLHDISQNSSKLKDWERESKDNDLKREELNRRREHKQEEVKAAKALGETIIDVVDTMDNHSESVAENVETAILPVVQLLPFAAYFGAMVLTAKTMINPALKKISEITKEFGEREDVKNLIEKLNTGNKRFSVKNLKNKYKLNKINNSELKNEATKLGKELSKNTALQSGKIRLGFILTGIATVGSFLAANIFGAKIQVSSSKVARYQAREDLKDEKNFVQYTPEQIEEAKNNLEQNPTKSKSKSKLKQGFFSSIFNLFKDNKAYQESKKTNFVENRKVQRELTPEEIEQAEKDKEVIQRTIKKINNEAEKYSENMEVAGGVIITGTPWLGGAIGAGITWIMEKTGAMKKIISKMVNKVGTQEAKDAYNEFAQVAKDAPGYNKKFINFAQTMFSDVSISRDGFGKTVKKIFSVAGSHKFGGKAIIGAIGGFATGIVGAFFGLKLQKEAARAGRYTAKRELEKDPMNFIGYTEKDMAEVADIKSDGKSESKIKEVITFLPKCLKQYFDYSKYKNTEFKERQALKQELMKLDVSESQLKDARNLQNKVFATFEKVDDKSQDYSESMEAACEIAQPIVTYAGIAALISPLVVIGVSIAKGKISAAKFADKATDFMANSSKIMQKDFVKKYVNDVAKNVPFIVEDMKVDSKFLGKLSSNIDFKTDGLQSVLKKLLKNTKNIGTDFRAMSDTEQINFLSDIKKYIDKLPIDSTITGDAAAKLGISVDTSSMKKIPDAIDEIYLRLRYKNPELRADVIDILLKNNVKKIPAQRLQEAEELIAEINKYSNVNVTEFSNLLDKANLFVPLVPDIKMSGAELSKIAEKFGVKFPKSDELLSKLKKKVSEMSDEDFGKLMDRLHLSSMDKATVEKIIPRLDAVYNNLPKEELNGLISSVVKELQENPDEFIKMIEQKKVPSVFMTPSLKKAVAAAGVSWTTLTIGTTYAIESWLADMQLKSGRLGVMRALEELDDNSYYANKEV